MFYHIVDEKNELLDVGDFMLQFSTQAICQTFEAPPLPLQSKDGDG